MSGDTLTYRMLVELWDRIRDRSEEIQELIDGKRDHVLMPDGFILRTPDGQYVRYTKPSERHPAGAEEGL